MVGESPSVSSKSDFTDEPVEQLDRSALLEKARSFLLSPEVRYEDEAAKRRFLAEKGLTVDEIDSLIRSLPRQAPPIPPRTYPGPPPSNLPAFLASLSKAMVWMTSASIVLLSGYYRLLLPRIVRSLEARHSLKLHQSELLRRMRDRIDELKSIQMQAYDILSLPADIKSLADLPVNSAGEPTHNLAVIVRSAFLDKNEATRKLTLEDLYQRLLKHFPGLKNSDESEYKFFISRELSRSRSFSNTIEDDVEHWELRQDAHSATLLIPFKRALETLRDAISHGHRKSNAYQHTFKSLTDLTAYLSRESFTAYGANTGFRYGLSGSQPLGPAEEDVRKEIRALKGLVLNRRTFAPSPYRPSLNPSPTSTVIND